MALHVQRVAQLHEYETQTGCTCGCKIFLCPGIFLGASLSLRARDVVSAPSKGVHTLTGLSFNPQLQAEKLIPVLLRCCVDTHSSVLRIR
jgi:hypothetical protein